MITPVHIASSGEGHLKDRQSDSRSLSHILPTNALSADQSMLLLLTDRLASSRDFLPFFFSPSERRVKKHPIK